MIGGTGKWAEQEIMEHLEGSHDNIPANVGDIQWGDIVVEVKATTTEDKTPKSGQLTMNQIRAMKYTVLVAYTKNLPRYDYDYVVIPPDVLVHFFLTHKGQSVPDGMASSNKSITLKMARMFGCSEDELPNKIVDAYERGEKNIYAKELAKNRRELYESLVQANLREKKLLEEWCAQNDFNCEFI